MTSTGPSPRWRDQAGTALVEFCWLALLLLVPLVYVVLTVFAAQRASFAAADAARVAGRAYLTAPDQGTAAGRAELAVRLAFADQGVDASPHLRISCRPDPTRCLSPGSVVTIRVWGSVPLPLLPAVLGKGRPSIRIESEHSAPYGEFREARP